MAVFAELSDAWKTGARSRRIIWLLFWGGRAAGYAQARAMDLSDAELVAAVRRGIWLRDYVTARRGSSHLEVMQAHAATGDAFGYACERRAGHGHSEAIQELRAGGRRGDPRSLAEGAPYPRAGAAVRPVRLRVRPSAAPVTVEARAGR